MLECLVLSVQVGKEMFCTFRQVQNSFQVDYFRTGIGYSGNYATAVAGIAYLPVWFPG